MRLSISSSTIPGHDKKGAKTLPGDNHCVEKPSTSRQNRESKALARDIKLENFTNVLDTLFEENSFVVSKLKRFFNEETDYQTIYTIWQSL